MVQQLLQRLSWKNSCVIALLALMLAAHLSVVFSILSDDRPVIWPLHNDTIHRRGRGVDFYAVYHAGVNLRGGMDPYENNPDGVTPYFYPFRYLPIVAITAQAFTLFSPQTAYFVWILVLEGILALLLVVLWKNISTLKVRLMLTGFLLINSGYFLELYMGQFTFASIALGVLALFLSWGPILFSGAVLLKPILLVALPAFARERRYWAHGAWAILFCILLSVPYFMRHPEQWQVFFDKNLRMYGAPHSAGNYGFMYLLQTLAEDAHAATMLRHWDKVAGAFRALTLMATALLVFHSKRRAIPVAISALILAHFLTYKHVWEHHMSGVCVLGALLMTVPDRHRLTSAAVLFSLFMLAVPTPFALFDVAKDPNVWDPSLQWPRYNSYVLILSKAMPTFILFVVTMAELCRSGLMSSREALRSALAKELDTEPGK